MTNKYMNLLPSDPLYWLIMADQAEENPSTILPEAFRTKIYNLYNKYQSQSDNFFYDVLSPNMYGMCYAIGDFSRNYNDQRNICPADIFNPESGEGYGYGTAEAYGAANGNQIEEGVYNIEENYLNV